MTELDAVLELASDNTAGVFSLSADTLAVLFFALGLAQNIDVWKDFPDEPLTDEQIDEITELLDWASDELMREVSTVPVGAIMIWLEPEPPADWLICNGGGHLKAEYPELFALYGARYGSSPDFFGVPDYRYRSPYGATFEEELDTVAGAETHTLTVNQIPAHSHNLKVGTAAGTGAHPHANLNQATQATTYNALVDTGGGQAHNNLHPVRYSWFIVYAGKKVEV